MSNLNNNRKNQPKFRPSLTIGDMLDCINALNKFNPQAEALNVLRQFTVKLAVTNPELFPRGVGTQLNSVGFGGANHSTSNHQTNASNFFGTPIAQAEGATTNSHGTNNQQPVGFTSFPTMAEVNAQSNPIFNLLPDSLASSNLEGAQNSTTQGYPMEQLPEPVRLLKEQVYIYVIQSGAVSANATEYETNVAIDTHIVKNLEENAKKLNLSNEVLSMMCPLAGMPSIEI